MNKPIGNQELEVLRFVTDNQPVSVRDVAERFGEPQGLARTTVLTVMERLRQKGYLERMKRDGIFLYQGVVGKQRLLKELVGEFIDRTLGGSISPLVAYLADAKDLTTEEVEALRHLVDGLEDKK